MPAATQACALGTADWKHRHMHVLLGSSPPACCLPRSPSARPQLQASSLLTLPDRLCGRAARTLLARMHTAAQALRAGSWSASTRRQPERVCHRQPRIPQGCLQAAAALFFNRGTPSKPRATSWRRPATQPFRQHMVMQQCRQPGTVNRNRASTEMVAAHLLLAVWLLCWRPSSSPPPPSAGSSICRTCCTEKRGTRLVLCCSARVSSAAWAAATLASAAGGAPVACWHGTDCCLWMAINMLMAAFRSTCTSKSLFSHS